MNYGIIDIGSNTIRLVIYKSVDGKFECLANEKYFVQLISYIKKGVMSDDGIKSMIRALTNLKEMAVHYDLKMLHCFATAPFRAVDQADYLIEIVKEFTGMEVKVLSGLDEAVLGVAGARYICGTDHGLFVDLGGGSMEISLLKEGEIAHATSIELGSVSVSNHFVEGILPKKKEIKKIKEYVDKSLRELPWLHEASGMNMYCIGGTSRALGLLHKVFYGSEAALESYSFSAKDIKGMVKSIVIMKTEGIRLMTKYCPGRIFTLVPGIIILARLAKYARTDKIYFSPFGVREGFLINNILKEQLQTNEALPAGNKTANDQEDCAGMRYHAVAT